MDLRSIFIANLVSRFGNYDELESLVDFLIPTRSPFFDAAIHVQLSDPSPTEPFVLTYELDFRAQISSLLFAVSSSPALTESLLAGFRELAEVTTLGPNENLNTVTSRLLNGGLRIYLRETSGAGTQRLRRLTLRELRAEEVASLPSFQDSPVREAAQDFRVLVADVGAGAGTTMRRLRVRMTRPLDATLTCLPWIADRPVFLRRFTFDLTNVVHQPFVGEVYPFMTTNENAHYLPSGPRLISSIDLDGWLYAGQGVMMVWSKRDSASEALRS